MRFPRLPALGAKHVALLVWLVVLQPFPGGAIAGIVVGVLVLAVPLLAIYSVWRQQRSRNRNLFGQVGRRAPSACTACFGGWRAR